MSRRVDLFDSTYGHFNEQVLEAIRKETFGHDIGQIHVALGMTAGALDPEHARGQLEVANSLSLPRSPHQAAFTARDGSTGESHANVRARPDPWRSRSRELPLNVEDLKRGKALGH